MKSSFVYRFFVILLVYLIIGVVIFFCLSGLSLRWILTLSIAGGGFVITEVVNEIVIAKRKKREKNESPEN